MVNHYSHISERERRLIAKMLALEIPKLEIARRLRRNISTINREIKRNSTEIKDESGKKVMLAYSAEVAHEHYLSRMNNDRYSKLLAKRMEDMQDLGKNNRQKRKRKGSVSDIPGDDTGELMEVREIVNSLAQRSDRKRAAGILSHRLLDEMEADLDRRIRANPKLNALFERDEGFPLVPIPSNRKRKVDGGDEE